MAKKTPYDVQQATEKRGRGLTRLADSKKQTPNTQSVKACMSACLQHGCWLRCVLAWHWASDLMSRGLTSLSEIQTKSDLVLAEMLQESGDRSQCPQQSMAEHVPGQK